MVAYSQGLTGYDTGSIKEAADFLNDIARVSNMSKANCEVADQHAQALYAALANTQGGVKSDPIREAAAFLLWYKDRGKNTDDCVEAWDA